MGQGIFDVTFIPLLLIAFMYFAFIMPQKRREKKVKQMLNALQVGNDVTTIGGIVGKVINIKDDEVTIETSVERTQIKVLRWAIKGVTSQQDVPVVQ